MTAARALRNLFVHVGPQAATAALIDEFPWSDVLPEHDRVQFVTDFVRAFQASAEMGQWTLVSQTIREWKATATGTCSRAILSGKPRSESLEIKTAASTVPLSTSRRRWVATLTSLPFSSRTSAVARTVAVNVDTHVHATTLGSRTDKLSVAAYRSFSVVFTPDRPPVAGGTVRNGPR